MVIRLRLNHKYPDNKAMPNDDDNDIPVLSAGVVYTTDPIRLINN